MREVRLPLKSPILFSTEDCKKMWFQTLWKRKERRKSCCCDEKSKRRGTKHKKSDCDKKSHFDLWVFFFALTFFSVLAQLGGCWRSLTMVTNGTLNRRVGKKTSNQNEYKLPWKHFSGELFCLLSMAGRTLLLYEPLQYPRWCNKISSHIFEADNLSLWCFSLETRMKRPTQKSVNYFFGFVETNGDCMKCIYAEENANEIFTVTASQHCSLLSFILLVSRKKKWTGDRYATQSCWFGDQN